MCAGAASSAVMQCFTVPLDIVGQARRDETCGAGGAGRAWCAVHVVDAERGGEREETANGRCSTGYPMCRMENECLGVMIGCLGPRDVDRLCERKEREGKGSKRQQRELGGAFVAQPVVTGNVLLWLEGIYREAYKEQDTKRGESFVGNMYGQNLETRKRRGAGDYGGASCVFYRSRFYRSRLSSLLKGVYLF